ncbi:cobalamin biosynthesis protein [Rhodovibrionaceae bacterium A322]
MPGAYGAADPLFLLLAALALEAYLGNFRWSQALVAWPLRGYLRLAGWLESKLNRRQRGQRALLIRGLLVVLLLLLLAWAAGALLAIATRHYPYAWGLELLVLIGALRQRRSWRQFETFRLSLAAGSTQATRNALEKLAIGDMTARDLDALPRSFLAPAGLAALARRFADSLVAPIFWYVLLGLPGLALQVCLRALAGLYGGVTSPESKRPPRAGDFALPVLMLERALGWIPNRLAGLLLAAAAAFVPGALPGDALKRIAESKAAGDSSAGLLAGDWPVAALGGALQLDDPQKAAQALEGQGTRGKSLDRLSIAAWIFAVGCLLLVALLTNLLVVRLMLG